MGDYELKNQNSHSNDQTDRDSEEQKFGSELAQYGHFGIKCSELQVACLILYVFYSY